MMERVYTFNDFLNSLSVLSKKGDLEIEEEQAKAQTNNFKKQIIALQNELKAERAYSAELEKNYAALIDKNNNDTKILQALNKEKEEKIKKLEKAIKLQDSQNEHFKKSFAIYNGLFTKLNSTINILSNRKPPQEELNPSSEEFLQLAEKLKEKDETIFELNEKIKQFSQIQDELLAFEEVINQYKDKMQALSEQVKEKDLIINKLKKEKYENGKAPDINKATEERQQNNKVKNIILQNVPSVQPDQPIMENKKGVIEGEEAEEVKEMNDNDKNANTQKKVISQITQEAEVINLPGQTEIIVPDGQSGAIIAIEEKRPIQEAPGEKEKVEPQEAEGEGEGEGVGEGVGEEEEEEEEEDKEKIVDPKDTLFFIEGQNLIGFNIANKNYSKIFCQGLDQLLPEYKEDSLIYNFLSGMFILASEETDTLFYFSRDKKIVEKIIRFKESHRGGSMIVLHQLKMLLVIGGKTTKNVERFNLSNGALEMIAPLESIRYFSTPVKCNDKLYVCMGMGENRELLNSIDVLNYNDPNAKWARINLTPNSEKLIMCSGFGLDDKQIIFIGGINSNAQINDNIYSYNVDENEIKFFNKNERKIEHRNANVFKKSRVFYDGREEDIIVNIDDGGCVHLFNTSLEYEIYYPSLEI